MDETETMWAPAEVDSSGAVTYWACRIGAVPLLPLGSDPFTSQESEYYIGEVPLTIPTRIR